MKTQDKINFVYILKLILPKFQYSNVSLELRLGDIKIGLVSHRNSSFTGQSKFNFDLG